jgi:transcriptional regulator with XRE-family HTH domain
MRDKPVAMIIKDARIKLQMTQEQLAESLGTDVMTVSRWECGVSEPRIVRVLELALRQLMMEKLAG